MLRVIWNNPVANPVSEVVPEVVSEIVVELVRPPKPSTKKPRAPKKVVEKLPKTTAREKDKKQLMLLNV